MGGTPRSVPQDAPPFVHKPGLNELLRVIGLDVDFHRAAGDLLTYRTPAGDEVEAVDLVAGYGALLLGHNHPALLAEMTRFLSSGRPNHTQGAVRSGAERLARALAGRAGGDFCVLFANSGTEAVESALKHALLETGGRTLIALEGGFHGKTLGSLQVSANPHYREPFGSGSVDVGVVRVRPNDLDHLQSVFAAARAPAGFLFEPLQGEAGIRPLTAEFVQQAAALCREYGIPLIADECQTGLGRTGEFLASHALGVQPDYIVLAKALGGGLAKISALLVRRERYRPQFDLLHSSTFADDESSCAVAVKVLELLDAATIELCRTKGEQIRHRLEQLRGRYPAVLREVRGSGLLLGVELQRPAGSSGYLLTFLSQQHLLGPLICSFLLHDHGVRIATTLSDPFTLRLQPSAFIAGEHIERLYTGLEDVCQRLDGGDLAGLMRFLASTPSTPPTPPIDAAPRLPGTSASLEPVQFDTVPSGRNSMRRRFAGGPDVAWIFHFVDEEDLVHLEPGLAGLTSLQRRALSQRTAALVDPVVLETVEIRSLTGERVHLHPILLPVTSEWLLRRRSGRGHLAARSLIQRGVDAAVALGCEVVTLGQFTSIVSRGGRSLQARGACLTSGNSYTAALIAQSVVRALVQRGLDRRELTLAVIGAAGDIGRTCTALLAPGFQRSILVGTPKTASHRRLKRLADETPGGEPATDFSQIRNADVVICATSCLRASLGPDFLAPAAIVCDVSVPHMLAPGAADALQGRTVLPGAVVRLPGAENLGIPGFPLETGFTYGCMAEGLLLGLSGVSRHSWSGPSLVQQAGRMAGLAERHGFCGADDTRVDVQPEDAHASAVGRDH
jgi:acetylornithine/succinyldiaminopimelate/putrescine aminotransferase/predicted amino acid dehydrogenase